MPLPRHTRAAAKAPVVPFVPKPAPPTTTLEQAGLAGSKFVATPEQAAEIDAAELARIAQGNAVVDAALQSVWGCAVCGSDAAFRVSGLCAHCDRVVFAIRAEQAASETINGRSRKDAVLDFLARQQP